MGGLLIAAYLPHDTVADELLLNAQLLRRLTDVERAGDVVGHGGDALDDVARQLRELDGVALGLFKQELGLVFDEVHLVCRQIVLILLLSAFFGEFIGVLAVGEHQQTHVHAVGQQHVDAAL